MTSHMVYTQSQHVYHCKFAACPFQWSYNSESKLIVTSILRAPNDHSEELGMGV